jgi:hypothetical protein
MGVLRPYGGLKGRVAGFAIIERCRGANDDGFRFRERSKGWAATTACDQLLTPTKARFWGLILIAVMLATSWTPSAMIAFEIA